MQMHNYVDTVSRCLMEYQSLESACADHGRKDRSDAVLVHRITITSVEWTKESQ